VANLYIIAGCNGAGKTTASYTILPEMLNCREFVNADEIARGLSPFQPEKVAIEAGRLMLGRIYELLTRKEDFAFETTLSTRSYVKTVKRAQKAGYFVTLVYFWLNSPDLAVARVKDRVLEGGHDVAEGIIRRRYQKGIENLFKLFIPISDFWMVVDNSENPFKLIAEGEKENKKIVHQSEIWGILKNLAYGKD
jgi:predicted ABC-type ATPase